MIRLTALCHPLARFYWKNSGYVFSRLFGQMLLDCNHLALGKKIVGDFTYYQCTACHQKFKMTPWDGKVADDPQP